ncbi:MAG: hypothetical protein QM811_08115 [Pirellulales bacterium]
MKFHKPVASRYSPFGIQQKAEQDDNKKILPDDLVTHIDGEPVADAFALRRILFAKADQPLRLSIQRTVKEDQGIRIFSTSSWFQRRRKRISASR